MADKTYAQLTSETVITDTHLVAVYPTGGPLKKMTWATFKAAVVSALGSTYLTVANNLSDLASASSARANLGLGTAAQLSSSALFQVANNLSEIANAATARANLGAAAAASPSFTGGMTYAGSTKGGVQAVAATSIDSSLQDFFTKSISADTTFTFTGAVAAQAQAFCLLLTISSAAVPTWPGSVKWSGGAAPTLGNGTHCLGFLTFDGGSNWSGFVGTRAQA